MGEPTRKRGISIFRAADAPDLLDTDFMEMTSPRPARSGASEAFQNTVLVRDAGGFSLLYAWFKANMPLGRHSHTSDCMYYVISGQLIMGSQTLCAGDSFFVPANAPYKYTAGPEGVEVLEIRYGVEQFGTTSYEGPEFMDVFAKAVKANSDSWGQEPVSPMYAANAAGR